MSLRLTIACIYYKRMYTLAWEYKKREQSKTTGQLSEADWKLTTCDSNLKYFFFCRCCSSAGYQTRPAFRRQITIRRRRTQIDRCWQTVWRPRRFRIRRSEGFRKFWTVWRIGWTKVARLRGLDVTTCIRPFGHQHDVRCSAMTTKLEVSAQLVNLYESLKETVMIHLSFILLLDTLGQTFCIDFDDSGVKKPKRCTIAKILIFQKKRFSVF